MDFIPTSLIKSRSTVFSEIISNLANLSISQGFFLLKFKLAQVTPLLKKPGLDKNTPSNYRPISKLNNIHKLLEHLILSRIQYNTTSSCNLNTFQSSYRRYYSTESALLLALDNIYHVSDESSSMVFISLNVSAAFNTIDHIILLSQLQISFGISGLALAWFQSYLEGAVSLSVLAVTHLQQLCAPRVFRKDLTLVLCFFSLFISPIAHIVNSYGPLQQQYADDAQLYVAISKDNYDNPVAKLELCLSTLHT